MKKNFLLLSILFFLVSCTIPQNEKKETETGKYNVSFSIGKQQDENQQNKDTPSVPDEYDQISHFILTISDSAGNKIINRKRFKKVNWAPGFVVSEPLELEAGSYTLEELILLDYGDNVLYATPRVDGELANLVNNALPVSFNVVNQDHIVYTQVIDVNNWQEFTTDPIRYFGYNLGIIDEVKTFRLFLRIYDIDGNNIPGDVTITYDGEQLTRTIPASGSSIYMPQFSSPFSVEVTASDGSGYFGYFDNSEFDGDNYFSKALYLTEEVTAQFVVKDEDGNDADVSLRYYPALISGSKYCTKEGNLYTAAFKADNSTTFEITRAGFQTFRRVFTLNELKDSTDTPIVIQLIPVTVTFPVLLQNSGSFPNTTADIEVVSTGKTTIFNSVELDSITSLTVSRVTDPVKITVNEPGIFSESVTKTISALNTLNANNEPLVFLLSFSSTLLEEGFESGIGNWIHDTTGNFNWSRISGSTPSSGTGPTGAYEGTYYLYTEASGNTNLTAAILSPYFNFDNQAGEFINMKLHMYGSTMGSISVFYQNEGSSVWNLAGSKSGDQGNSWQDFNLSLAHVTGSARIKISGTMGSNYYSDIAIDNVEIGW